MNALVIGAQNPDDPAAAVRFVNDWAEPGAPGPGEARVRTLCSALNHLDLWVAKGVPGLRLTYPRVSGSDACGVVESVGAGVDAAWVGARVILNAAVEVKDAALPGGAPEPRLPNYELLGEHRPGVHAAMFNAPVTNLQRVDEGIEPTAAAAFGLTFLTAYSMLNKAGARPGEWVLITGIGGGVATAALALARELGLRTIVTSREQRKIDAAKQAGAEFGVVDTGEDWSRAVRQMTGGRGVDIAVDSSGKATHLKCIKSLTRGGAYVTPGCTSGADATTDLARIFWNQLRILGSTMGTNAEFASLARLLNARKLKATVDRVFAAKDGAAAWKFLASGEQVGKVVIDWRGV
ncbi:zinc-binding dehydrogenase [soil metagenome]